MPVPLAGQYRTWFLSDAEAGLRLESGLGQASETQTIAPFECDPPIYAGTHLCRQIAPLDILSISMAATIKAQLQSPFDRLLTRKLGLTQRTAISPWLPLSKPGCSHLLIAFSQGNLA